jgi:Ankyrin repeat
VVIGCVIHFFYMCLLKPVDFVELEKRVDVAFTRFSDLNSTVPRLTRFRALWIRVGALAYLFMVLLGVGLCIYGGMIRLLSWMPHSWVDSDGTLTAQSLAGVSATMGALGLIVISMKTAHGFDDLVAAIRDLTIKSGNLDYFRQFLLDVKYQSLNTKNHPHGWTLMHQLAALGNETRPVHAKMAEELCRSGANVNCRTVLGWTPLHFIAMQGQAQAVDLAKVLVAHGLDLAAVDKQGRGWKGHWQHGKEIYDLLENASTR